MMTLSHSENDEGLSILIISLCKYKLHEEEFVGPLVDIFKEKGNVKVIHYKELEKEPKEDVIILSGTAIKDFEYLNYLDKFKWIKNTNKKVIGVGAGSQIIALTFGGKLKKKGFIGVYDVNSIFGKFRAYFLIVRYPVLSENFEILGYVKDEPAIFKVKNREIYGFTFHPEVLNSKLLLEILSQNF